VPTPVDYLNDALKGLSTERLNRLVDRLEEAPNLKVTVGSWRPQCPMVLAGFDPTAAAGDAPEHRFAAAWDRFASPSPRPRWVFLPSRTNAARRADVQFLLRRANAVLAARVAATRTETRPGEHAGPAPCNAEQARSDS
jgi:hypothetical protein